MLVLRPADVEETTIAWRLAMENMSTPTALILSRQNIVNLPAGTDYSQAAKGAYIIADADENPDVILVASGSGSFNAGGRCRTSAQRRCESTYCFRSIRRVIP